jgi:hypothetical protein
LTKQGHQEEYQECRSIIEEQAKAEAEQKKKQRAEEQLAKAAKKQKKSKVAEDRKGLLLFTLFID